MRHNKADNLRCWAKENRVYLFAVFIAALILILRLLFFDIVYVKGNSMYPTLGNNDILFVNHFQYKPAHGDIVIIQIPSTSVYDEVIVKRIIAISGETVEIDYENNTVYVDDSRLIEPYINQTCTDSMIAKGKNSTFIVPEGYVFVLGDNRNYSTDSRNSEVGMIHISQIVGNILIHIPLSR